MTTEVDALILRYLQDLEAELRDLPANRRQELLDEVGEHIATARAGARPRDRGRRPHRAGTPRRPGRHRRRGPRALRRPAPAGPAGHPVARGDRPGAAGDPVRRLGRGGGAGVAVAAVDHPRQADRHPRRDELGAGRAGDHHDLGTGAPTAVGSAPAGPDARRAWLAVVLFAAAVRPAGGRRHLPRVPAPRPRRRRPARRPSRRRRPRGSRGRRTGTARPPRGWPRCRGRGARRRGGWSRRRRPWP